MKYLERLLSQLRQLHLQINRKRWGGRAVPVVEKRKRWVKTFSDAPDPAVQYFVKSIPLNLKGFDIETCFQKVAPLPPEGLAGLQ